jgi:predicted nuclease of predicted toxin-antitoxin system
MKLLIDMNLSPQWIEFLAERGFESVHWSTIGDVTASDSRIMDYAAEHQWIVFTHDLDFGALLARRKTRGPSVIQIRGQKTSFRTRSANMSFVR